MQMAGLSGLTFPAQIDGSQIQETYCLGSGCLLHTSPNGMLTITTSNSSDSQTIVVYRDPTARKNMACLLVSSADSDHRWFLLVDSSGNFKLLQFDTRQVSDSKIHTFEVWVSLAYRIDKLTATSILQASTSEGYLEARRIYQLVASTGNGIYTTHIDTVRLNLKESVDRSVLLQDFRRVDWCTEQSLQFKAHLLLPVSTMRLIVITPAFSELIELEVIPITENISGLRVVKKQPAASSTVTLLLNNIEGTEGPLIMLPQRSSAGEDPDSPLACINLLAQLLPDSPCRLILHRGSFILVVEIPKYGICTDRLVLDPRNGNFTIQASQIEQPLTNSMVRVGILLSDPQLPPQTGNTTDWVLRAAALPLSIHLLTNPARVSLVASPTGKTLLSGVDSSTLKYLRPVLAASDSVRSSLHSIASKAELKNLNRVLFDSLYPPVDPDQVVAASKLLEAQMLPLLQVDED